MRILIPLVVCCSINAASTKHDRTKRAVLPFWTHTGYVRPVPAPVAQGPHIASNQGYQTYHPRHHHGNGYAPPAVQGRRSGGIKNKIVIANGDVGGAIVQGVIQSFGNNQTPNQASTTTTPTTVTPPPTGDCPTSGFTSTQQTAIVNAHNTCRSTAQGVQTGFTIPNMAWSATLASDAQRASDRCVLAHVDTNGLCAGALSFNGQNLLFRTDTSFSNVAAALTDAQDGWCESEKNLYNVATNMCIGSVLSCGFYTQVVWSDSIQVGCGLTHCPSGVTDGGGNSIGPGTVIVCDYQTPGNILGQRPFPI